MENKKNKFISYLAELTSLPTAQIKMIIYGSIGYLVLFKPVKVATFLGTWIHDFFGTLITYIFK